MAPEFCGQGRELGEWFWRPGRCGLVEEGLVCHGRWGESVGGDCVEGVAVEVVGFAEGVVVGIVGSDDDGKAKDMVPLDRRWNAHVCEFVILEA